MHLGGFAGCDLGNVPKIDETNPNLMTGLRQQGRVPFWIRISERNIEFDKQKRGKEK
jgi:hypothetical protein